MVLVPRSSARPETDIFVFQRGGAGNIGSPTQVPKNTGTDDDIIPENARVKVHEDQVYHSGVRLPSAGRPFSGVAC